MQTDRQDTSLESIQPSIAHGAIPLPADQPGGAIVTDPQPTAQKNTSAGDIKNWENNTAHPPSPSGVVAASSASHADNDVLKKESGNTPQAAAPSLSISPQKADMSGVNTFDSLLPGLETYVNEGAEDTDTANQQQQVNSHAVVENHARPSDVQMEDVPQSESNFENLFVDVDFGDPEDLLNNAEIGELDDSWFT